MMNVSTTLSLQVVCQLIGFQLPYPNDANLVASNPSAISNQSPPSVQLATLPDGYIAYPEIGAAYKILFNEVTWSEARERCNLEGAHLAILDSQRKLDYVHNTTYDTYHRTSGYVHLHTGIRRMDEKWVDVSTGKTLSDLPWTSGYPDSSLGDCALADIGATGTSYLHNNAVCSGKYFYLCEVPIPKDYKTKEN